MPNQETSSIEPALSITSQAASAPQQVLDDKAATHLIEGFLDSCGPGWITGWLIDKAHPSDPLEFDVLSDGVPVGRGIANLFRKDLLDAGLGKGRCAFKMLMPQALFDGKAHVVELRHLDGPRCYQFQQHHECNANSACEAVHVSLPTDRNLINCQSLESKGAPF